MAIPTIILRFLFIAPLCLIGFFSSYSDIKYGKIKNPYLKIGFIYICCLYFFLFIYSQYFLHVNNNKYFTGLLLNGSISLIIGYLLWWFNLWAAGDAKLFTLYSLLIPLEVYSNNYIAYFPSFIMLIDTFTIIIVFLLSKIMTKFIHELVTLAIKRDKTKFLNTLKNIKYFMIFWMQPKNLKHILIKIFNFLILLISLLIILQVLKNKIQIVLLALSIKPFLVYAFLLLLHLFLFRIITKNKIFRIIITILGLILCLYLLISQQVAMLVSVIKWALFMMFLIGIFIQSINWYLEHKDIKTIAVRDLQPGIFLTQASITEIQNELSSDIKFNIKEWSLSDGLMVKQIEIIQEIFQNKPQKALTIYSTFPFAPFLFLAFIFSFITKTSVLPLFSYLLNLIR